MTATPALHLHLRRYSAAAGVFNALAMRLSGPGDSAVTLEERLQAFQDALMQVRGIVQCAIGVNPGWGQEHKGRLRGHRASGTCRFVT
jgi:hypothetical protein